MHISKAERAAALLHLVKGIDLSSADGRAGITALLREIESAAPGTMERMAAGVQLRKMGWRVQSAQ